MDKFLKIITIFVTFILFSGCSNRLTESKDLIKSFESGKKIECVENTNNGVFIERLDNTNAFLSSYNMKEGYKLIVSKTTGRSYVLLLKSGSNMQCKELD